MDFITIVFTLLFILPLTFPFIVLRTAIFCLAFYLRRRYSISLSVAKCGILSFRTILIEFPSSITSTQESGKNSNNELNKKKVLSITIDNLRLSSLYIENSCASLLSICFNKITIQDMSHSDYCMPIKIGSLEFPIDKMRVDFIQHYKECFNVNIKDILITSENFSYNIERVNLVKSIETQKVMLIDFNQVVFNDLSVPETQVERTSDSSMNSRRILFVETLQLVYTVGYNKNIQATITGDCFAKCNLEFYINFTSSVLSIKQLFKSLKQAAHSVRDTHSFVDDEKTPPPSPPPPQTTNLEFNLSGRLSVGAVIAPDECVRFETHTLEINASFPGPKTIQSELMWLHFDEHQIVTLSLVSLSHYPSPGINCILDRKQNSCSYKLNDSANSLLNIEIELVSTSFPNKYNFSSALNEKFLGIIKWLKKFHRNPDRSNTQPDDKPIDFDISLRIDKFVFDIEDDPFETKLRTNYMLLEDEYHEQLKRDQTLQEKINELKRTNLMLASSVVDELNRALAKKNSDIYIQRSKQLYSADNRRMSLFSVVIEETDLKILADSSFHKHNDIKSMLKNLNPESPTIEDISFTTIFCRVISGNFKKAECTLRDFNLPMLSVNDLTLKGMILGTEQAASFRARRNCTLYVGRNSPAQIVERSMTPLKFYHNLQLRCTTANYTHGPCWEPVLQQVSLAFEDIISASSDPSPSLPWWDKVRFILHGSIKLNCNQLSVFLHASNDPYNQTEVIESTLSRAQIDYATGKFRCKGDFDVLLRTASKYDECRFIHIPNFDTTILLQWNCLGNPNDHNSIMPCAPDKVPDYSSHDTHDSYRSFRSGSLNLKLNLETQYISPTSSLNPDNMPSILFFGSTIRWLENQKFIFVGPSKLTRRGVLFNNTKPKKPSLSRTFKEIHLTISMTRFQILYWSSVSKRHGIHAIGGDFSHCSEHTLKLISEFDDELKHRPQSDWQTVYINSSLNDVEIWLYNLCCEDLDEFNEFNTQTNIKNRRYFISLDRVSYNKEPVMDEYEMSRSEGIDTADMQSITSQKQKPYHRLVIHDLKAAWTKENRDVVVGILDSFINSQQLKRNLSTDALKPIRVEPAQSYQHNISGGGNAPTHRHQRQPSTTSLIILNNSAPMSSVSKNRAVSMLQKLIADSENNPNVYSEELHSGVASETHLYGVEACQMDDVVDINCSIELVNSQVVLCGTETPGYVIVNAANTEVRQATHLPVWKNRALLSKTTWTGTLKNMQCYATVDEQSQGNEARIYFTSKHDVQWLESEQNIDSKSVQHNDYIDMVINGGQSVGGVVGPIVGKHHQSSNNAYETHSIQLQRIISKCDCLFYFASHTVGVPDDLQHLIPPLPEDDMFIEPWDKEVGVDSFTLTHQDLNISTNSQQYAMILDIINNLLLYIDPHKKTAFEKLERMRFKFQLSAADEDQREPISQLQDRVRKYVAYLKRLERERYIIYRASIDASIDVSIDENRLSRFSGNRASDRDRSYRKSLNSLSDEIYNVKEQLNSASEELSMMISCYKETQLSAHKASKQQAASQHGTGALFANVIRRNELSFKSARWRVTDSDGQLGLADISVNNFLYSKVVKSDDSVEHTIELGHLQVSNLMPNQPYKDVLRPTELQANIPLDRQRALRIYCRELAPVAGIPVKEHLEINVVPFTIEITLQFFQKMVKFFFPEKDVTKESKRTLESLSELQISRIGEEIEKMRERASKNHTFVYVKIPGIPIRVSYKGKKQKSVTDLKSMSLTLPTYEYHNSTWTWLDLLMAVKNDSKHTVIKQALKQKMKIRPSSLWSKSGSNQEQHTTSSPETAKEKSTTPVTDEDKARLLLGPYATRWRVELSPAVNDSRE